MNYIIRKIKKLINQSKTKRDQQQQKELENIQKAFEWSSFMITGPFLKRIS